jgi:hypothetical protein
LYGSSYSTSLFNISHLLHQYSSLNTSGSASAIHQHTNISKAIGGAVWHGVKGFRNSPYGERRIGALTAIKARAPVLGGNFGVWGGLFSTFDCAVKGVRKKEDPYNASMCLQFPDLVQDGLRRKWSRDEVMLIS